MSLAAPRSFVLASILAIGLPAMAAGPAVIIESGQLAGTVQGGVASWKGIPFAEAPVGPLRWRAPQPVTPWSGVRQATVYGHDCMQLPFPSDAAPLGTAPSEDCLYANVWRPAAKAASKGRLPVIVWIYGGGFVNGGSSPPTYAGARLARQGVMVVSFNYRLGRFGFFGHPALSREIGEQDLDDGLAANQAFMDQLAALKWVRRNAEAFGGDPAQVTIFGESAGGMAVNMLLTAPAARGLFARAVVLSGGDGAPSRAGLAELEQAGANFGARKGIAADDPQALDKLRALPPDSIVDGMNLAHRPDGDPTYVGPIADGRLAVDPAPAIAAGRFAKVPVMIGATGADIGGRTGFMVAGARSMAGLLAAQGAPVYAYRFSYVAASVKAPGAQHATDIPFFFDTAAIKYGSKTTARDRAMGRAMSAYLVNFAKHGDPNGAGLPAWPLYTRAGDALMDFAANGKPVAGKDPWGMEIDAAQAARQ